MSKKNTEETKKEESQEVAIGMVEFKLNMAGEKREMLDAFVTYLKTNNEPTEDTLSTLKAKFEKFKVRPTN